MKPELLGPPNIARAQSKVVNLTLTGGLVGYLWSSPRKRLQQELDRQNKEGWHLAYILNAQSGNLFLMILRWLIQLVTLGIYVPLNGYYLIMERTVDHVPATPGCPQCGGSVEAADRFCQHCGHKLK